MNKTEQKLSIVKLLALGGVIFSMHFGGSSMIWPMTWGKESGSSVLISFIGVFFTALLFPLLGYVALARGKGSLYQVTKRISINFANIFCGIIMLVLGPLFCIPRMSAAAWDAFTQLINYKQDNLLAISIFSITYYLITYWFIFKKDNTVDKVSKLLCPILLVAVIIIIGKGLMTPLGPMADKTFQIPAFVYGFTEGYATLELPCALVYATIVIENLRNTGIKEEKLEVTLVKVAAIGIGILTLTHLGHMIVGANTGNLFSGLKYAS
ncbi:branched-chain amino acid transport system II carrier protein, partial [Romboutsia sp.]|uniref:branched-chain amino acid transport system II carrier protein n=1 Tax=Romboutsia sp. TaxID=1965302 RepID=UPI003F2FCA0B